MEEKEHKKDHERVEFDILKYLELRDQLTKTDYSSSDDLKQIKEEVNKEAIRAKWSTRIKNETLLDIVTKTLYVCGENINSILEREAKAIQRSTDADETQIKAIHQRARKESKQRSTYLNELVQLKEQKSNYELVISGADKEIEDLEQRIHTVQKGGAPAKSAFVPPVLVSVKEIRERILVLYAKKEDVQDKLESTYLAIERFGQKVEQSSLSAKAYENQIRIIRNKIRMKNKLQMGIYSPDFMSILENNIDIAQRAEEDESLINGKTVITKSILATMQDNIGSMLRPYKPQFTMQSTKKEFEQLRKEVESAHEDLYTSAEQAKSTAESVLNKYL